MLVTNSLTGGGAERAMNLLSIELLNRGWPTALVPINAGGQDQVIPLCDVFPLERPWNGSLASTFKSVIKFNQVVRSWRPDVVILNCDLPELLGALLFVKVRLVAVEHSSIPWIKRPRLGKLTRRILGLRNTRWVAVSSHLKIWPQMQNPLRVLQNPIIALSDRIPSDKDVKLRRLFFVGRLSVEKKPEVMLHLAERLSADVEIVGDGALQESLTQQVNESDSSVHFLGRVDNPWKLFQKGDLLIVPSSVEGDGLVVIEALQMGVPFLLSDIEGFRRFNFPEKNYCQDEAAFIARILENQNNLEALLIPAGQAESLLAERSIPVVASNWEAFLPS